MELFGDVEDDISSHSYRLQSRGHRHNWLELQIKTNKQTNKSSHGNASRPPGWLLGVSWSLLSTWNVLCHHTVSLHIASNTASLSSKWLQGSSWLYRRSCGLKDKAPVSEAGDCGFESRHDQSFCTLIISLRISANCAAIFWLLWLMT